MRESVAMRILINISNLFNRYNMNKTTKIKSSLLKAFFLNAALVLFGSAWGQNKMISGIIKNQQGSPVQGASVSVKGSKASTVTDANGAFSLSVPDTSSTLAFSYVGYAPQEVTLSPSQTTVSISLKEA